MQLQFLPHFQILDRATNSYQNCTEYNIRPIKFAPGCNGYRGQLTTSALVGILESRVLIVIIVPKLRVQTVLKCPKITGVK